MNTFQQKYPLSSKKFWKKLIASVGSWCVLGLLGIISISVVMFSSDADTQWIFGLGIGIILVGLVLVAIGCGLYIRAYIKGYFYDGGESFITIKKGVFAPTEIHVQYQKIQDVYVDQDILDRIMGLYDVHIASATVSSGIEAHIDGVEKEVAEGLKNFFLSSIHKASTGSRGGQDAVSSSGGGPAVLAATSITPLKASFTEEISSKTYPTNQKWYISALFGSMISSASLTAILILWLAGSGKGGRPGILESFGFEGFGGISLAALIIFIVILLGQYIYTVIWQKNFSFQFTSEYIFTRTGIIAKQEKHVPYNTLQDVSVSQGVMDRLFGIATVIIENAASSQMIRTSKGAEAVFNGISIPGQELKNAQKIAEVLKGVIVNKSTSNGTGL